MFTFYVGLYYFTNYKGLGLFIYFYLQVIYIHTHTHTHTHTYIYIYIYLFIYLAYKLSCFIYIFNNYVLFAVIHTLLY